VVGWDRDPDILAAAVARGCVTPAGDAAVVLDAPRDVVVLAGPPTAVIDEVAAAGTANLVMDVAGVKAPVLAASRLARFVGTHPMAGREVAGPEAASAGLFRGAAWLVTTDGATAGDLAQVEALIGVLGARPVRMTAAEHDRAVALVSHLPQLLAAGLMNEATDRGEVLDLVAGSFRDLTRVAASDPALWVDVLQANRVAVLDVLDEYIERLGHFASALEGEDRDGLAGELTRAAVSRRRLGPPLATVGIALADEPGELARVGHALERSRVDVRDLQLRHAPFGGGGVLTVSVREGDATGLRAALLAEGLLLLD
jgi:prephenate dehydrogenase